MGTAPRGRKPQGGARAGPEDARCPQSSGALERRGSTSISRRSPSLDVATRRSLPSPAAAHPQMSEFLIMIEGSLIGRVRADKAGRLTLNYEAGWRDSPQGHALSVSMPLAQITYMHRPVLSYLWNLLPENPNLLPRWGQQYPVSGATPFKLLANVGADVPGAAQFIPPERLEEIQSARKPAVGGMKISQPGGAS